MIIADFSSVLRYQRKLGKGRIRSIGAAISDKTKEKLDPRNYLFSRYGTLASLFPSLKGHRAKGLWERERRYEKMPSGVTYKSPTKTDDNKPTSDTTIRPSNLGTINALRSILARLITFGNETKKALDSINNTLFQIFKVLSKRDSFSEDWFSKQKEKENIYEESMREKANTIIPSKVEPETEKEKTEKSGVMPAFLTAGILSGVLSILATYFKNPEFKKSVDDMMNNLGASISDSTWWKAMKESIHEKFGDLSKAVSTLTDILAVFIPLGTLILAIKTILPVVSFIASAFSLVAKRIFPIFGLIDFLYKKFSKYIPNLLKGETKKTKTKTGNKSKKDNEDNKEESSGFFSSLLIPTIGAIGLSFPNEAEGNDGIPLEKKLRVNREIKHRPPIEQTINSPEKVSTIENTSIERLTDDDFNLILQSPNVPELTIEKDNSKSPSKMPNDRAKYAMDYFMSVGWTKEQAAGIVGNLMVESNLNPKAYAKNGKEESFGIAQWNSKGSPERVERFLDRYGVKDIRESTFDQQLDYVNYELNTTESAAGNILRSSKTAKESAEIVDNYYERSSRQHIKNRVNIAEQLSEGTHSSIGMAQTNALYSPNDLVNTSSEDNSIIGKIEKEIKKHWKEKSQMVSQIYDDPDVNNQLKKYTDAFIDLGLNIPTNNVEKFNPLKESINYTKESSNEIIETVKNIFSGEDNTLNSVLDFFSSATSKSEDVIKDFTESNTISQALNPKSNLSLVNPENDIGNKLDKSSQEIEDFKSEMMQNLQVLPLLNNIPSGTNQKTPQSLQQHNNSLPPATDNDLISQLLQNSSFL